MFLLGTGTHPYYAHIANTISWSAKMDGSHFYASTLERAHSPVIYWNPVPSCDALCDIAVYDISTHLDDCFVAEPLVTFQVCTNYVSTVDHAIQTGDDFIALYGTLAMPTFVYTQAAMSNLSILTCIILYLTLPKQLVS